MFSEILSAIGKIKYPIIPSLSGKSFFFLKTNLQNKTLTIIDVEENFIEIDSTLFQDIYLKFVLMPYNPIRFSKEFWNKQWNDIISSVFIPSSKYTKKHISVLAEAIPSLIKELYFRAKLDIIKNKKICDWDCVQNLKIPIEKIISEILAQEKSDSISFYNGKEHTLLKKIEKAHRKTD